MEVMAYYLDELYSTETYRAVPEEKNNKITAWLDYRRSCIDTENKILDNKLIYSVSPAKADSIKGKSEYQELFSKFHSYSDPYYYNPMQMIHQIIRETVSSIWVQNGFLE